jgi:tRNA1(Val) A37 N6-methylase TrmN6
MTGGTTTDLFLRGAMRLVQPQNGHRSGTDALLLAHAALPFAAGNIADFGAGVGAAGIALALQSSGCDHLALVEIDPALMRLGVENLAVNGLGQGEAIRADVTASATIREKVGLARSAYDCIIMNPPFRDQARSRGPQDGSRALAHVMQDSDLQHWVRAAAHHLKPGGALAMIHRADALALVLQSLGKGFGGALLRFVHPRADAPALRLLITARKGSRAPLTILPPLMLHGTDGAFTDEAAAIHHGVHHGKAALPD